MENKKRVLVVEDEEHMRALLTYNLNKENYEVKTAKDGFEGLEEVKKQKPDLIISDIMMPKMDGYEFCRTLRKDPKARMIPFIFLTAKGQLPDKVEGLRTGADDYITKPFVPKELIEMVNARLERVDVYKKMADIDELTELYNHRALLEQLTAEVIRARRLDLPVCVGFMDIDLFRKVNERFGHPAGDIVLKKIADAIKGSLGKEDVAGRWGGEEFLVIFPAKTSRQAYSNLEKVRTDIEKLTFAEKGLSVTISIGISSFPSDARNADELVALADKALFRAKNTGRNRSVLYSTIAEES
jgi:two-component system cell cycle response regulator